MATQAQIDANRRNAQKSTGPRTDAGKAAVRQNALRHGLCSTMVLMDSEPEQGFTDLQDLLRQENQPLGANEEILVHMMAVHFYNYKRADAAICDAIEASFERLPPGYKSSAFSLSLSVRYQQASFRQFMQALNQLRKLQKERQLEDGETKPILVDTPPGPPVEAPAEAPKPAPTAANSPAPPPDTAPPAPQPPVAPCNPVEKSPSDPVQTPPKAA